MNQDKNTLTRPVKEDKENTPTREEKKIKIKGLNPRNKDSK